MLDYWLTSIIHKLSMTLSTKIIRIIGKIQITDVPGLNFGRSPDATMKSFLCKGSQLIVDATYKEVTKFTQNLNLCGKVLMAQKKKKKNISQLAA